VVERLRSRRTELEDAIFARLREDQLDSLGSEDAEYTVGLRQAVAAAVDYVLEGIERRAESLRAPNKKRFWDAVVVDGVYGETSGQ
jgi:hypothetical protein